MSSQTNKPNTAAVLLDGTISSAKAFEKATKGQHETLYLVHAIENDSAMAPPELMIAQQLIAEKRNQAAKEMGTKICNFYSKKCEEIGAKNCVPVLIQGKEHVCDFMEKQKIETIYVGQRQIPPTQKFFLGSFSNYILSHCKANTFVVKNEESSNIQTPQTPRTH